MKFNSVFGVDLEWKEPFLSELNKKTSAIVLYSYHTKRGQALIPNEYNNCEWLLENLATHPVFR